MILSPAEKELMLRFYIVQLGHNMQFVIKIMEIFISYVM